MNKNNVWENIWISIYKPLLILPVQWCHPCLWLWTATKGPQDYLISNQHTFQEYPKKNIQSPLSLFCLIKGIYKTFLSNWYFSYFFTCAFIFHFSLNSLSQWLHLNTLALNSWLFLCFFKLINFQKCYHNCCIDLFLFQKVCQTLLLTNSVFF